MFSIDGFAAAMNEGGGPARGDGARRAGGRWTGRGWREGRGGWAGEGRGLVEFKARVRIDTPREADYYRHGGILQYVLRGLLAS